MKKKFRPFHIVVAAVNAAAIAGALILTGAGNSMARSQRYNYAAERWQNGSDTKCGQVSCFFSSDAGFDSRSAKGVKAKMFSELKNASVNAEEGQNLVTDAYSASAGRAAITSDIRGRSEADITAVGGDFFFFRDFMLASGSFFSDKDLRQDGAVIDEQLAWALYGSDDITGKNIYINNVRLYISGVIKGPDTKAEERSIGKAPRAYISYYAAGLIFGGGQSDGDIAGMQSSDFRKVTCYECVSPDPVEKFTYNTVKEYFKDQYDGKLSIVNNTERFTPKKRSKALKQLEKAVVRSDNIIFPYWENASRIVELRLSFIYGGRKLLLIIPLITLICLIIAAYKTYIRKKEDYKRTAAGFVSSKWRAIRRKKKKTSDDLQDTKSSEKEHKEQTKESKNKKD